jgi:ribonuclease HI
MESGYHIVTIRVNETSWAHVWRLRSHYLGTGYDNLEVHKLLYSVLIASRKLCHYFQAHKILMVTSYPLKAVLHNPNTAGNIAK